MQVVLNEIAWIRFVMASFPPMVYLADFTDEKDKNVTKHKQKDVFSKCSI